MPKLENFAAHIKVNGNPFAKNAINYQINSGDTVGLYYSNDRDQRILGGTLARFDDWTNLDDVAYSSFALLVADLDLFLWDRDGFVSLNNSSTDLLDADEVKAFPGDDVSDYASVTILYKSDVAAAASGLSIQFSQDNINWDVQLVGDLAAKTFQVHSLNRAAKWFRIEYTNGPIDQGIFRLQCMFHKAATPTLITRTGQPQSTIDATPTRLSTDIELDFARKHIPGGRSFFFFGFNDSMANNVWEDVQPNAGDINWQTAGQLIEVVSTNAADNGTTPGIGCHSVEVHGLSDTGVDQDEIILTNGTTPVPGVLTYRRVNKMHNEVVGTYGGSHEGDITCQVAGAGALLSKMTGREGAVNVSPQYGTGEAGNGYWTVPLGKVMYITGGIVIPNTKANQTIDVILYEREGILNTTTPFDPRRLIWDAIEITESQPIIMKSQRKIKQLTDIFFRAKASGAGSKLSVQLDFYLVDGDASGA